MGDILTGAVLIGLGFVLGASVFMGDFSVFNIIFDGLGVFFIVKGLLKVVKSKQAA
jgi:uncharacterized membrane protein